MKLKSFKPGSFLATLVLLGASGAGAQPTEEGARAVNPPNVTALENMTPAQRQAAMKQMVTRTMTESLKAIGITDEKTVTLILQFTEEQEKSRQNVRLKAGTLALALVDKTQTDEQVSVLLKELLGAVAEARAAQKADIATLEELTKFSEKPKLQAVLTTLGLIGDESPMTQGVMVNFFNAMGMMAEAGEARKTPAG